MISHPRKIALAFCLCCCIRIDVFGHEDAADHTHSHNTPPQKEAAAVLNRPTAAPDRIILTLTDDPAHSQAVTWRTNTAVTKGLAQIGLADDGPQSADKAKSYQATTTVLHSDLNVAHYHSVTFADLKPKTKYAYRVGDGVNWSEWIDFTTAADKPEPFAFIYFGDAQNDLKSHWSRVVRAAYADLPQARFMIHAGDLINNAHSEAEWGEWFYAGGWLNASVPSFPSPGNHEYGKLLPNGDTQLSDHWRPQFTLPENGPPGLMETVYYVDYQGTRLISLNSNVQQKQQAAWLEKVLAENPQRWTVIAFHHPIYSPAKNRDNPSLRKLWQPIFDKYRVDLVLQGHDHTYARTGMLTALTQPPLKKWEIPRLNTLPAPVPDAAPPPTTPSAAAAGGGGSPPAPLSDFPIARINAPTGLNYRSEASGTVYVVSVSGPKMYGQAEEQPDYVERVGENTQLYQIIQIDGRSLRFEARTARGELYDAFILQKRDGQTSELVEIKPTLQERRLPQPPATVAVPK